MLANLGTTPNREQTVYRGAMSAADLPPSIDRASPSPDGPSAAFPERLGLLARAAASITAWAERWVPDAFVFALAATVFVCAAAMGVMRASPRAVAEAWGAGFWDLLPFTMQMSLVIITGYVLASTRPVYALIARLAAVPRTGRGAVAWVAFLAMASSWLNWGFSLIFSAVLAKETARRVPHVDYRAVAASAFLGLGSIWAQGLSGSAALQMATPAALPKNIRAVVESGGAVPGGIIPLSNTIFLWQSVASVLVEIALVTLVVYLYAPPPSRARTAAMMGVDLGPSPLDRTEPDSRPSPGEWLERSRLLTVAFVTLAVAYLGLHFARSGKGLAALDLNSINLAFLTVGFALHGTPARLMRAVREATPGVWGVILQFPLYAGIASVIVATHLNERIASLFVSLSSPRSFPAIVALYSAALGVFVPSGGSKWVIEAPYVMRAAHELRVHLGWVVATYDLGEAVANLVQPFWMLPILGLFGLRARDVMGYTLLVFLVLTPVVLVLVTVLGATLAYPL
jgi:short-chain fatty acids transporter